MIQKVPIPLAIPSMILKGSFRALSQKVTAVSPPARLCWRQVDESLPASATEFLYEELSKKTKLLRIAVQEEHQFRRSYENLSAKMKSKKKRSRDEPDVSVTPDAEATPKKRPSPDPPIVRQALTQCCRLRPQQADHFGTHNLCIGAIELLRAKGVSAEIRQQLGGWMSAASALGYLQLPVAAQFNMVRHIFC